MQSYESPYLIHTTLDKDFHYPDQTVAITM